jgi:hypothetical protein
MVFSAWLFAFLTFRITRTIAGQFNQTQHTENPGTAPARVGRVKLWRYERLGVESAARIGEVSWLTIY